MNTNDTYRKEAFTYLMNVGIPSMLDFASFCCKIHFTRAFT